MLEKIKVGVMDLLTILLPGGILLLTLDFDLKTLAGDHGWYSDILREYEWAPAALFFCGAYVSGHFLFFISSWLDDIVYDKVGRVYWHEHNRLIARVKRMKKDSIGFDDPKIFNTFKWSNMWLLSNQPAIYAEVERYMAESKFFRSLVVVFIVLFWVLLRRQCIASALPVIPVLIFLSLIRYVSQRKKSIETAYHGVLTTYKIEHKDSIYNNIDVDVKKLDEKNICVLKRMYQRIKVRDRYFKIKNKNRGDGASKATEVRFDKKVYELMKFLYVIGLCFVPFFEYLTKVKKRK